MGIESGASTKEETLREICNQNVGIAQEVRTELDNALGSSPPTDSKAEAISPNVMDQALEAAKATRGLLRGIQETLITGILNRI